MVSPDIYHQFYNQNLASFPTISEAKEFINNKILLDVPANQVEVALGIFQNSLIQEILDHVGSAEEHF